MKIVRGTKNIVDPIINPVVAIGNFDGAHIGHQTIFRKASERAREIQGTAVVLTFEPHPLRVIAPEKVPLLLTTFRKKMELIEQCGINVTVCADFNRQFADQRPRDFAHDVLVKTIGAKEVVVGHDYAFGRGREGTTSYLEKMGVEFGFKVHIIKPVTINDQTVSSSRVRELIENGQVEKASEFLGRPYSLTGPVIQGVKTGGKIGFPTANIDTRHVQIPGTGVYAVYIVCEDRRYRGVVNVGFNPTFHRDRLIVEVHILNFHETIYGKDIEIEFIKRIRNEVEFQSADELVAQIKKDIETAKTLLEEQPS